MCKMIDASEFPMRFSMAKEEALKVWKKHSFWHVLYDYPLDSENNQGIKKIDAETFITLMQEKFPNFIPYWESYIGSFGLAVGVTLQVFPLCDYTIDVMKSNDESETKRIFDFVEFLLDEGDDYLQTALATSYLEYLMNKDPDEIQFRKFSKYLGKNSIDYCRAWDEFMGCKTEGLWDV